MKRRFLLALLGVVGGLVVVEGGLRSLYFVLEQRESFVAGQVRVIALGESTTQGGPTDNYPYDLNQYFKEHCQGSIHTLNLGLAGVRSDDIARDLSHWMGLHPSIALIMMGINDIQGTGGPVAVVGKSPFRIVRLARWALEAIREKEDPEPKLEFADDLGKLNRWDYYRLVTQPLLNQNRLSDLESLHRAVLKAHPENHAAKIDLGSLLRAKGKAKEALALHLAAVNELPEDPWSVWECILDYEALNQLYQSMHGADILIKQGTTLPMPLVTSLAQFLEKHGDTARRDQLLDAAVKREEAQAILQWLIASAREKSGKVSEAEAARTRAQASANAPYPASLAANYKTIVRELRENGVTVLALSYPRQPIAPLAALFPNHEVELVSLEEPFNEAVKKQGYDAIFYDSFGGNFGHMTKQGNELLANVVAQRLMELPVVKAACGR